MFDKNISFWCVVLFFVVAMIIHHILSQNSIIEGNENKEDENKGNMDMSNVKSFKFTIKGNSDAVTKMLGKQGGEPGSPPETGGAVADGEAGAVADSEAGAVAGSPVAPGTPAAPAAPAAPGTPADPAAPAAPPDTPVVSPQMIQPVDEGLYHYYPGLLHFEGSGASSLNCKGVKGGGGDSLSVQQAKDLCNSTEDCDGFFHYNSTGNDRTCFKKDIDISKGQKMAGDDAPNSGLYVVHGEKPDMWVLGQTNQDCNAVCDSQEGNLKCLSGNWKMEMDEYKQALFDGGLKDEDSVNTVEDVDKWCGKISGSVSPTRPGTGNASHHETQCFYTNNNNTDCESKHSVTRRLCKCGVDSNSP